MIIVTPDILSKISDPYKSVINNKIRQQANFHALPFHINHWFQVYDINKTQLRVAHFLAQSCYETENFLSLTERPRHGGMEYEPNTSAGRKVGNHSPGDGPKFIGRGLLHLTGYDNYKKYGNEINEDLVNHPEIVASDLSLAVRTSCMFWQSRRLNQLADKDDFDEVCLRVNGGINGKEQRRTALKKSKKDL